MSKAGVRSVIFTIMFVGALAGTEGLAATVAAGNCRPTLKSFSTIQAAVNAAGGSGTVLVCPGTYAEQVTISTPLTLKGVSSGTSAVAVIVPPASGLAPIGYMALTAEPVAAQLLVQNTSGVTISSITVDGAGAACPLFPSGQQVFWVGIGYAGTSSGTITGSVVRNVTNSGCQWGAAIFGDQGTGALVIQNNSIHDCWNGVSVNYATSSTIRFNTISRVYSAIGVGSLTGPLTISNNTLVDVGGTGGQGVAINVGSDHASTSTIANNIIYGSKTRLGVGINLVQSDNASISSNKISGAYEGVALTEDAGAIVKYNTVTNTFAALTLNDNGSVGGNIVTNNTVNEASCGIDKTPASVNDTTAPNTMLNVITTSTSGSCP